MLKLYYSLKVLVFRVCDDLSFERGVVVEEERRLRLPWNARVSE